ncbi:MAG: class I SAM-dependent methyltransferase [Gemmatimonadales bacterium]
MTNPTGDRWLAGDAYEAYMGRWSRQVAREFVRWLAVSPDRNWLEVGCGTGALTTAVCALANPASITACDPAVPFIEHARASLADPRVAFTVAAAGNLPTRADGFDAAVSGLVFNFIPDPAAALRELGCCLKPGGIIGAYVWDYADGMEFLRIFWEVAARLDPAAAALDEGRRFALCGRGALEALWRAANLGDVAGGAIEVPTTFASFDEYWQPFLLGTGPAPSYVASLTEAGRSALGDALRRRLAPAPDGSIALRARAWAARGTVT